MDESMVAVQFGLSYPEGMTRAQALEALAPKLGPIGAVEAEDGEAPTVAKGRVSECLTIEVRPEIAERLERRGNWSARLAGVRIYAETP